ncbi:hypothetical protein AGABI1DRAFT_59047 [Agaricus bisporus var. burnettii JB137-S8]|uniref:Uncharacterized protein n=2 Tax=Agaricus bisporus var. burnettii TaxID=192524 RepID=K5XW45_AGABU|nr:uncharacterized protein AGABI1DRAFT_59047 [Agaricus bisporus var. burnettii JB137-S8]EKM79430.1 hypothetical protein AGABI1DRAFT_59047 [Agaricus bisporus var. burnettii JB137-S8]KAF7768197.1 hypothetical protein Agabi119p4_7440 [Agaricus bisporus var. burnettii]
MASTLRLASLLRTTATRARTPHRLFTNSVIRREEASTVTPVVQKKPIGGIRGGIVGFLFGFSLASSYAAYHLLDEYQKASAALQASVEELKLSTEKVSAHVRRIEAVEKDLKALGEASASKEDINRVRAEMKKLYDGLHVEFLDLRAHVWGIQQDIHKLSKKEATSVRI